MTDTLLPPNATQLEKAIEKTVSKRLESIPYIIRTTTNFDLIPSVWLPWLAWGWRVENWDSGWSDQQKRASIKVSYAVHRSKGTFGSIRKALDALGIGIEVIEWFKDIPRRSPYTFRIQLNPGNAGLKRDDWQSILNIINTTKNSRSHLTAIDLTEETNCLTSHAGIAHFGFSVDIPAAPNVLSQLTVNLSSVSFGMTINIPKAEI